MIDHGADARRLVKKVKRAILRRAGLPAFDDLMHAGEFVIAVVTATEGKAKQIRRVIKSLFGRKHYAARYLNGDPRGTGRSRFSIWCMQLARTNASLIHASFS